MAENEVLDVGGRQYYKRWRAALPDTNCGSTEVADLLFQDCLQVLRAKLRGKPFYLVLEACGSSREALTAVIQSFKGRELAKIIAQASSLARSKDPALVGEKLTTLLVDRLTDRARTYSFRALGECERQRAIVRAVEGKMRASKAEIASLLVTALRNQPIPRGPRRAARQASVEAVLESSLVSAA